MAERQGIKVIILVGGEKRATRFRPLSLHVPKPLFPVGGSPMITHHIRACQQLEKLEEVVILGSFEEKYFDDYAKDMSTKFNFPVR